MARQAVLTCVYFSFPVAPLQGAYGQASATSGEYRGSHQVEKSMTPDLISQKQ